MHFVVYSQTNEQNVKQRLGMPEYSYYFVVRHFIPLLEQLGTVVVANSELEVRQECYRLHEAGKPTIFLQFSAPHNYFPDLPCPAIPVFAWEFDTLPNESWAHDERNNWRWALVRSGAAITHSQYTVKAVCDEMGPEYAVISLPCAVWDDVSKIRKKFGKLRPQKSFRLQFEGEHFDSQEMDLGRLAEDRFSAEEERVRQEHAEETTKTTLSINGVVYTSLFNPYDFRKNWQDMISAFCWAFRDTPDATLVLKLSASHIVEFSDQLIRTLIRLAPFRCRVIAIRAYLDGDEYKKLMAGSSYYVNTSYGEGQCLPLMEFLSAGIPAVAPDSTALADYMSKEVGFVVASHDEPSFWQHDERRAFRTFHKRVDWKSLHDAYRESYRLAKQEARAYRKLSKTAVENMRAHCSREVLKKKLASFIESRLRPAVDASLLTPATPPETGDRALESPDNEILPESREFNLTPFREQDWAAKFSKRTRDTAELNLQFSGWHNLDNRELAPSFRIDEGDVVIDVNCGTGHNSAFCANWASRLIFCNPDENVLERARGRLADHVSCETRGYCNTPESLDVESGIASKVICTSVLEAAAEPLKVLEEMCRIGRPDCRYLFTSSHRNLTRVHKTVNPYQYFKNVDPEKRFSRSAFRRILQEGGFVIEHRYYGGFYQLFTQAIAWSEQEELHEPWDSFWRDLLRTPKGRAVKAGMDRGSPSYQIVIARKKLPGE